jgi:hypothetical protein
MPVRLVGEDEPWEQVVQDIHARLGPTMSGRNIRVGFYGHGAFIKPTALQNDVPFAAALGEAAALDVMLFPHWRFPETDPFVELPRQLLHAQLSNGFRHPIETVVELVRAKARQLGRDNRYATAHAAVRLAEGISVFHRQHMTPSLAAFSNSALVLVRLGQLLEQGRITDGYTTLSVPEGVRQGISLNNVVTFGYPLPHGQVSPALQQRIRGTFVNVVPAQCAKQWLGNFLLRGGVENLPVPWAPAHADWPHLALQGPEVAELGTLLNGHGAARSRRPRVPLGQDRQGGPLGVQGWWEVLCAEMQRLDLPEAFESP